MLINIGTCNGLLPDHADGTKPLPWTNTFVLTYNQWCPVAFTWRPFQKKCLRYKSLQCICVLQFYNTATYHSVQWAKAYTFVLAVVPELFISSLFKPGAHINPEHKSKYIFILSYAACVVETWKKVRNQVTLVVMVEVLLGYPIILSESL